MADVFVIALYIVIVKGARMVTVKSDLGFSDCILASILPSWKSRPGT